MTDDVRPPAIAEALLRALLTPRDRETVSGDLLEEYRQHVHPARGCMGADVWYLGEVMGFVWRAAGLWSVLLAVSVIGRDAIDWWLAPTSDFYARSIVSTSAAVACFACAGAVTAWRTRAIRSGMVAGIATGLIAAVVVNLSSSLMLALEHDAHTLAMIRASGGLEEVFVLPLFVILPGTLCATVGAVAARTLDAVVRSRFAE